MKRSKMPYEVPVLIWKDCLRQDVITNSLDDGGENGNLTESDWGDF